MRDRNVTDFEEDVQSKTTVDGKTVFVAQPGPDGAVQIVKNGVPTVSVLFSTTGGAVTDANPTGAQVVVKFLDGTIGVADAVTFLQTLK